MESLFGISLGVISIGTMTPIIYAESTATNWDSVWKVRATRNVGIARCTEHGYDYTVEMENSKGLFNEVGLKLIGHNQRSSVLGGEKIVFSSKLENDGGGVRINVNSDTNTSPNSKQRVSCQEAFVTTPTGGRQTEEEVLIKNVKLVFQDVSFCEKTRWHRRCELLQVQNQGKKLFDKFSENVELNLSPF